MALFENFPYTNLHELNLDWLINELKAMEEAQVLSVNGLTGHVILYQDANVVLPEVQDSTWSFFRTADGVIRGITFAADGTAYIMNGDQLTKLYSADNAPDFSDEHIQLPDLDDEQITNWNIYRNFNESLSGIQFDETGSAYVISGGLRYKIFTQHDVPPYPVTSVNGQTGAVVLYPDPAVRFPDIIDNEVNYWSIFRYVNNGAYGIQFNTNGNIDLITPGNRTTIYTATNQPPYPVTSVNSMTGDVELDIPDDLVMHVDDAILEIAEPADNYTWGFTRETDNGEIGIVFDNQNANNAYIRYYDSVNEEYVLVKLLTNSDIPSSAGVSSVNGQTGAVTVNGANITVSSQDNTPLNSSIDEKAKASNVAFYEPTNTASQNIPVNSFVFWNGGAYIANQAISLSDTLSLTNLDAITSGGIVNSLNSIVGSPDSASGVTGSSAFDKINTLNTKFMPWMNGRTASALTHNITFPNNTNSLYMVFVTSANGQIWNVYIVRVKQTENMSVVNLTNNSNPAYSVSANVMTLSVSSARALTIGVCSLNGSPLPSIDYE